MSFVGKYNIPYDRKTIYSITATIRVGGRVGELPVSVSLSFAHYRKTKQMGHRDFRFG